jgi:hypothetical protein
MRIIAGIAISFAAPAAATPMHLVCIGSGSTTEDESATAFANNSNGQSSWATVTGERTVQFQDQVNIELEGGAGKIRLPRTMLPMFRGGKDGWFELRNVKTTDTEITASAAVNFINSPKVRLDRTTGRISIDGKIGQYSGTCEPYDPAKVQRKF